MSVCMRTWGSRLRFKSLTALEDAAATAAAKAMTVEFDQYEFYRTPDIPEGDTTWDEVFWSFRQQLFPVTDDTLTFHSVGHDDRLYEPDLLWANLAPYVTDGSWYSYTDDEMEVDRLIILHVKDGEAHRLQLSAEETAKLNTLSESSQVDLLPAIVSAAARHKVTLLV